MPDSHYNSETSFSGAGITIVPFLDVCEVERWRATMAGYDGVDGIGRTPVEALNDLTQQVVHRAATEAVRRKITLGRTRTRADVAVAG